jgi:hypothetical protein
MSGLSAQQLEALAILRERGAFTAGQLHGLGIGANASAAGVTAGSLVSRGLARKVRHGRHVVYEAITVPR